MANALSRYATFPFESMLFGPAYGWLRFKIRSPEPLDAEAAWDEVTGKIPPVFDWLRQNYPPTFMRSVLIASHMRQAHVKGIAAHYDVSNAFYKLFLDDKYMFYTCADFPTGTETIEEAQGIKANHLVSLIDPHPGGRLVQHFFCRNESRLPATAIVGQIFFPGSLNAAYADHVRWNEAAGFRITQRTIHDYRPTLRAWFNKLVANRDEAIKLVGVETYNRYVLFFPSAYRYFDDGVGKLVRWLMEKPAARP